MGRNCRFLFLLFGSFFCFAMFISSVNGGILSLRDYDIVINGVSKKNIFYRSCA